MAETRDQGQEYKYSLSPILSSIRAAGKLRGQMAYRTGLASAAERGVALGEDANGLGGLAQQEIQPRVAMAEAETERDIQDTINQQIRDEQSRHQREQDQAALEAANHRDPLIVNPITGRPPTTWNWFGW